jgi:hypothetical protein
MEKRKPDSTRSSPLPKAYLKMVTDVFASNFDEGLKKITKITGESAHFEVSGNVHPSEIVLCVTLIHGDSLSATSIYGSADFDPKASSPTIQDLLGTLVDGIGAVLFRLINPEDSEDLENLVHASLSALKDVPFEWTSMEVEKRRIWVKLDKANPKLEKLADEWLAKNDPTHKERLEREQEETEKLFVTGPTTPGKKRGLH